MVMRCNTHQGGYIPIQLSELLFAPSVTGLWNTVNRPATIHKRIHELKDDGFVSFEGQEGDSRVRLVVPTEQALRYFAEHAKVI